MLGTFLRKVTKTAQFYKGASIKPEHFRSIPFKNNFDNLAKMFQLRNWYIQNSPHTTHSHKYSNDMAYLHNELNYLNSKQILSRTLLTAVIVLGYAFFVMDECARDYKDQFDLKFNQKAYGSIADSSGQGASSMDD